MKEDDMSGLCSTHGYIKNLKGTDGFGDLGVGRRIILKLILKQKDVNV
jgi:hypothetical protein